MKNFLLLLFLLLFTALQASIDFTKNSESLMKESSIYIDSDGKSFQQVKRFAQFVAPSKESINLGFARGKILWVRLDFINSSAKSVEKVLQVKNPLLERVALYDENGTVEKRGTVHLLKPRDTLHSAFLLRLKPHERKLVYLKVQTATTALRLDIALKDRMSYIQSEYKEQTLIFIFLATLFLMLFYNVILYFYTKERVYMYYVLYLFSLIYQQSTYLGITQMFFPVWFIHYDNLSVVLKVNLLYITAILFAKSFLHTQNHPQIDKIYNLILFIALIEIPLFGTPLFYLPEVAIVTALIFIYFNMYAGIVIYKRGYIQARLFVAGWAFQLVGFTLMILNGLGLISIMHKLPELVMLFTLLEAIILSLAFFDRYAIYKKQKDEADAKLLQELKKRQQIVEVEVEKATSALQHSLENEKVLLKELHHRTKNNLQLILSLARMQADTLEGATKEKFQNLVGRINSIAKTHALLYRQEDLEQIDMGEYLEELCSDLAGLSQKDVLFDIKIENVILPVEIAGYIGLITNELVTNSIKYVAKKQIIIYIGMYKKNMEYVLSFKDNGEGSVFEGETKESLGLQIVQTLVNNQLEGVLDIKREDGFSCLMRFKI